MPNWVYNTLSVTGNDADMDVFRAWLDEPLVLSYKHYSFDNEPTDETQDFGKFTFHKIIPVPVDIYDEYWATSGFADGKTYGNTSNNWYNWNTNNWWTKWDACEVDIEDDYVATGSKYNSINIRFETAWGQPEPIFYKLAEMFPHLKFFVSYDEEQGWGGECSFENGQLVQHLRWDIPASHADYENRHEECHACSSVYKDSNGNVIGLEYLFDDCPRDGLEGGE